MTTKQYIAELQATPQQELEARFIEWYHQARKELDLTQIEAMETIRTAVDILLEGLYELRGACP